MELNKVMRLILPTTLLIVSVNGWAQNLKRDSVMRRDASYLYDSDPWLGSGNGAALTRYAADNLSWAELSLDYGHGGFVNYNESKRDLHFGAGARSLYRLSRRTVVYGRISYESHDKHDMTGSVFIQPERYPFNIVEDSLSNAGKIHQDTYSLQGGLGAEVTRWLAVGARVDFTAANAAKYKDLRHKNSLMNIDASAGIYVPATGWLALGGEYHYMRHSESLDFNTYSSNDVTYKSLIEYGGMMGEVEQFGSEGFTGRNSVQPLFYDGHGYGLQAQLRLLPRLEWFHSWRMAYLKGYYGKDTPSSIVYTRHGTHRWQWYSRLQYRTRRNMHNLNASIGNEKLDNYQNQFRQSTNEHNARYYEYFQPLKTADKVWVDTHVGYTGYFGLQGETPLWKLMAGSRIAYRKLTAYNYPYYRRQRWTRTEGYIDGARNVFMRRGILTLAAGLSYINGSGDPYTDGTFVNPSDVQQPPAEMTAFLWREYAAVMAPQYELRASAKYAFIVPLTAMKGYIGTEWSYRHCNQPNEYLEGKTHWRLGATIGVNF